MNERGSPFEGKQLRNKEDTEGLTLWQRLQAAAVSRSAVPLQIVAGSL